MTNCVKRLLPLALAAALAGCTMQATDSNATRYQVALVAKSKDSEFWNAVFTGAEAAATEYNMQLTIAAPNSEEDYEEQDRMIEKAVEDGAQAIVFSAIDYEKNAAAIDAAAAAGVTIIGIDSAVDSAHVAAYIGADNYGAGQIRRCRKTLYLCLIEDAVSLGATVALVLLTGRFLLSIFNNDPQVIALGYDRLVVVLTRDGSYRKGPMPSLPIDLWYGKYPALQQRLHDDRAAFARVAGKFFLRIGKAFT